MDPQDAFKRAIKQFLNGTRPEALIEASGGSHKYSLEYFEELEAELMAEKDEEEDDAEDE